MHIRGPESVLTRSRWKRRYSIRGKARGCVIVWGIGKHKGSRMWREIDKEGVLYGDRALAETKHYGKKKQRSQKAIRVFAVETIGQMDKATDLAPGHRVHLFRKVVSLFGPKAIKLVQPY